MSFDNYENDQRPRRPAQLSDILGPVKIPSTFVPSGPLSERAGELLSLTINNAADAFVAAARKAAKAYEDDAVAFAKEVEDMCVVIRNNAIETASTIEAKHATFRKAAEGMREAFKCFPIINAHTNGGNNST